MMKPGVTGRAEFCKNGRCRWWLERRWDLAKGLVFYVGLNPSRAGADADDMTVTKGMGFARRKFDMGGTLHGNAYPFITPYPSQLEKCSEEEIAQNDVWLLDMARRASVVVLAWGSFPQFKQRFWKVARLLREFNPICLGTTKDGYPCHISRIGYDRPSQPWNQERSDAG